MREQVNSNARVPLKLIDSETPAEHIRNALAILDGAGAGGRVLTFYRAVDIAAIAHRLQCALDLLQLQTKDRLQVTSAPRPALVDSCVYCGCTEVTPCDVQTAELSERDRGTLVEYFAERGQGLPELVPCWWLWSDQPVCSNPSCQAALLADRAAALV